MKSNKKWFKKVRGSYLPNSWQGAVYYLPYLAYLLFVYYYAMTNIGYNWTSILIIIPNWVAAAAVMTWAASKRS